MIHTMRAPGAVLVVAAWLGACAPAPVTETEPKNVVGHPLKAYELHEECLAMQPGDRVDWAFESTQPVDFNIHFHEGNTVLMPVVREKSRADAGVYAPVLAQHYCLMWEAGPAGAAIDYRLRLRPAGR